MVKRTALIHESETFKKEIISDYVRLTLNEETKPGEVYRKLKRKINSLKAID